MGINDDIKAAIAYVESKIVKEGEGNPLIKFKNKEHENNFMIMIISLFLIFVMLKVLWEKMFPSDVWIMLLTLLLIWVFAKSADICVFYGRKVSK